MNKLLVGSIALAAVIGAPAAFAADMPLKAPPPVVAYSWTGCYLGLNIGTSYGRSRQDFTPPIPTPATDWFDLSGLLGGAQAGCNYQVGAWVFGVEGDWDVTNKDGQSVDLFNSSFQVQTTERSIATARARLGYAVTDKWLWYVTGGGAWAKVQDSFFIPGVVSSSNVQDTKWIAGWTVGGGTEYALGYGWSIKSEFLYVDFGTKRFFDPPNPNLSVDSVDVKLHNYIFRFGMNYKFGWSPAVVAKY